MLEVDQGFREVGFPFIYVGLSKCFLTLIVLFRVPHTNRRCQPHGLFVVQMLQFSESDGLWEGAGDVFRCEHVSVDS